MDLSHHRMSEHDDSAIGCAMMLTPMQAARKICEHGSWKVTNLQLQKILYLAQMLFMAW